MSCKKLNILVHESSTREVELRPENGLRVLLIMLSPLAGATSPVMLSDAMKRHFTLLVMEV
ncbi:hypothetical protein [Anaplasma phagocytophilum]|uniref:hypothetical protein n=1 Tax=Anaplasma phagocytophilum TaxID=948 RepID=UPI00201ACC25